MYEYQIERLGRLHNFVRNDKKFKELDIHLQIDIILSFFMHCYHLSDWLVVSGIDKRTVKNFVHNTYEMQICRNLTNSTKHLELDPAKSSPPEIYDWKKANFPSPITKSHNPFAEILGTGDLEYLVIPVDGVEINCMDLMSRCIQKWNEFIENVI